MWFTLTGNIPYLIKTSDTYQLSNIYYNSETERGIYNSIESVIDTFVNNSKFIQPTLSLTSSIGYFIGLLWNCQVASYYLFIPI